MKKTNSESVKFAYEGQGEVDEILLWELMDFFFFPSSSRSVFLMCYYSVLSDGEKKKNIYSEVISHDGKYKIIEMRNTNDRNVAFSKI